MKLTLASCLAAVNILAITFLPSASAGYEPSTGAVDVVLKWLLGGREKYVKEDVITVAVPSTEDKMPTLYLMNLIENDRFLEVCRKAGVMDVIEHLKFIIMNKPYQELSNYYPIMCAKFLQSDMVPLLGEIMMIGVDIMERLPPNNMPGANDPKQLQYLCEPFLHPQMLDTLKGNQKKSDAVKRALHEFLSNWQGEYAGCTMAMLVSFCKQSN